MSRLQEGGALPGGGSMSGSMRGRDSCCCRVGAVGLHGTHLNGRCTGAEGVQLHVGDAMLGLGRGSALPAGEEVLEQ